MLLIVQYTSLSLVHSLGVYVCVCVWQLLALKQLLWGMQFTTHVPETRQQNMPNMANMAGMLTSSVEQLRENVSVNLLTALLGLRTEPQTRLSAIYASSASMLLP